MRRTEMKLFPASSGRKCYWNHINLVVILKGKLNLNVSPGYILFLTCFTQCSLDHSIFARCACWSFEMAFFFCGVMRLCLSFFPNIACMMVHKFRKTFAKIRNFMAFMWLSILKQTNKHKKSPNMSEVPWTTPASALN